MTTPVSILLPAYSLECPRCERAIEYRCDCPAVIVVLRPGAANGHRAKCKGLPPRCPKCRDPKWLEPRRWKRPDLRRS